MRSGKTLEHPLSFLLLLLIGLICGACGTSRDASDDPQSILIVSIDTLRADHLGCYGYFRDTSPTIDRLARESILFERAMAPMSMTLPSHTSLLTGTEPLEHGVLANIKHGGRVFVPAPGLRSFAEFATERGYRTAGFVSAPPLAASTGIGAGFELFDEPEQARTAGETNENVFGWIEGLKDEPFLLWVHYFDPHQPYRPPEEFDLYGNDEALDGYLAERGVPDSVSNLAGRAYDTREATNLYDGEIRYVDHELDRLIERLKQAGRWDDTVVVLVSDHGESVGDHGFVGHEYITREQLQILMLLRLPGAAPSRVATPTSIVDALPTAIGLAGDDGWSAFLDQASGRNVRTDGEAERAIFGQRAERERADFIGPAYSLLAGNWRLVYEPQKQNQLFDWSTDPHELENVIDRHPEIAGALTEQVLERVARYLARGAELRGDSDTQGDVDPELYERLRALGYVE